MTIDYERFARVITRSIERADESNADAMVVTVFKETLAGQVPASLLFEVVLRFAREHVEP